MQSICIPAARDKKHLSCVNLWQEFLQICRCFGRNDVNVALIKQLGQAEL